MNNKRAPIFAAIGVGVVLIVLFAMPRFMDPKNGLANVWKNAGVECLSMGHSNIAQHFHPHLTITVDGVNEEIPANVGITNNCMAEVHMHDLSGTIHVETIEADKIVHLKNFLTVYGKPINRDGYDVSMTVDGKPNKELDNLVLADKQQIILNYAKRLSTGEK